MKFFTTAEAYKDVSRKLVDNQNIIAIKIKHMVNKKDYGEAILNWGHINIANPPEFYQAGFFKEIHKYSMKEKDLDLRLKIDYESMLHAEGKEVLKLICDSILRGIDIAENELKIKDFDFDTFRNDLINLFMKEGWIQN